MVRGMEICSLLVKEKPLEIYKAINKSGDIHYELITYRKVFNNMFLKLVKVTKVLNMLVDNSKVNFDVFV